MYGQLTHTHIRPGERAQGTTVERGSQIARTWEEVLIEARILSGISVCVRDRREEYGREY